MVKKKVVDGEKTYCLYFDIDYEYAEYPNILVEADSLEEARAIMWEALKNGDIPEPPIHIVNYNNAESSYKDGTIFLIK